MAKKIKRRRKKKKTTAAALEAPDVRHLHTPSAVQRIFRHEIRSARNERTGKLEELGLQNV